MAGPEVVSWCHLHGNQAQTDDETERLGSGGSSSLPPTAASSQQHVQTTHVVPGSVPYTGDTKTTGQSPSRSLGPGEKVEEKDSNHEGGQQEVHWGLRSQEWLPGGGDPGLRPALKGLVIDKLGRRS